MKNAITEAHCNTLLRYIQYMLPTLFSNLNAVVRAILKFAIPLDFISFVFFFKCSLLSELACTKVSWKHSSRYCTSSENWNKIFLFLFCTGRVPRTQTFLSFSSSNCRQAGITKMLKISPLYRSQYIFPTNVYVCSHYSTSSTFHIVGLNHLGVASLNQIV